jgi:hypothetical protein
MASIRKAFHIGDILTLTTGYILSPRGSAGVRELEHHLAGRQLEAWERIVYTGAFRSALLQQHPGLPEFSDEEIPPPELLHIWLARRIAECGEYLTVAPLTASQHPPPDQLRNPLGA